METYSAQIQSVESLLSQIPAEVISKRAVECKSFSRALFHWEQYIRQCKALPDKQELTKLGPLYQRLQDIYTQIDEPDGIEGISAHLHVLNIDQQVLEHRKSGRWTAAQSWYELQLDKEPNNNDAQLNLITCLKESGQLGTTPFMSPYLALCLQMQMHFSTNLKSSKSLEHLYLKSYHSLLKLLGPPASGTNWITT